MKNKTASAGRGGAVRLSATAAHRRGLKITFALTGLFLLVEVAAGLATGSLALLADAGHMLTGVGGLGLFLISFYILFEAYRRFADPPQVASLPMLATAVVGLAVNLVGIWILHKGSQESLNLRGAFLEVVSDALGSVGVIVAGVIMLTTGWYYADPLFGVLIGLFILPRTWRLMAEAVNVLLEGTPAHINLHAVRRAMLGVDGVAEVHDLHVWTITSGTRP